MHSDMESCGVHPNAVRLGTVAPHRGKYAGIAPLRKLMEPLHTCYHGNFGGRCFSSAQLDAMDVCRRVEVQPGDNIEPRDAFRVALCHYADITDKVSGTDHSSRRVLNARGSSGLGDFHLVGIKGDAADAITAILLAQHPRNLGPGRMLTTADGQFAR